MLKKILRDKEFVNATLQIAIPVTIQSLIASSLNTLDTFMITKLGTAAIAGVGLANQVFFFFSFFLFGLNTGSAILFSQFNGREDY
ncbi:MAG: MATE family efflux transporter, partial [Ezakiella massiliensis]